MVRPFKTILLLGKILLSFASQKNTNKIVPSKTKQVASFHSTSNLMETF